MKPRASLPFLGIVLALSLAACGSTVEMPGTGGLSGTGASSTTSSSVEVSSSSGPPGSSVVSSSSGMPGSSVVSSSSGPTTVSSSSMSSSSGSTCAAPMPLTGACGPISSCTAGSSTCLAHVDQAGSTTPGFRMSALTFTKPAAFMSLALAQILQGAVLPDDPGCDLSGTGAFSWLLRFDTTAGTIETGGAKPAPGPAGPYAFVDAMVQSNGHTFHVQPATMMGALTSTCGFASGAGDVTLPVYLDPTGQNVIYLPLRGLTFLNGTVTPDLGCIGRYNSEGLTPFMNCQSDATTPAFLAGAALDAHVTLEDADAVVVTPLNETLCVLLSGDPMTYGVHGQGGLTVCRRDPSGAIVFKGDWCSMLDQPAITGCADAMRVQATFAAQAVQIQ